MHIASSKGRASLRLHSYFLASYLSASSFLVYWRMYLFEPLPARTTLGNVAAWKSGTNCVYKAVWTPVEPHACIYESANVSIRLQLNRVETTLLNHFVAVINLGHVNVAFRTDIRASRQPIYSQCREERGVLLSKKTSMSTTQLAGFEGLRLALRPRRETVEARIVQRTA